MTKIIWWLCILVASDALAGAGSEKKPTEVQRDKGSGSLVVLASSAGAALDTDLMTGGGTDDTAALQAVLNRAASGGPIHLIIDGAALVSGLNTYGRTTVECLHGGGLYLKDNSSRAIIRNANRSKRAITDEHITIRGCFLNGNRDNQPSAVVPPRVDIPGCCTPSNKEADGTFITGLQFLGVNDLTIENVTVWNVRAFGVLVANANRIAVRNLTVDYGSPPDILDRVQLNNTDGLMFKGPLRYASVDGLKVRAGDDGLALNADTWEDTGNLYGPYVGVGPITDVVVNNLQFMDTILGIRFISAKERVDRVTVSNVTGTIRGWYLANLSRWVNPSGRGNFGSIIFDNVNVDRSIDPASSAKLKAMFQEGRKQGGELGKALAKNMNDGDVPSFSINAHFENLTIRNMVTKVSDDRPILWFGPDTHIQMLAADLTLLDPQFQAVPLKLDEGSRIDRLDFALRWSGPVSDQGRNPIVSLGGTVGEVHWVDTPPQYTGAELIDGKSLVVTFSQAIKARDFNAGVEIKVNGKPVGVVTGSHESGRSDAVRYVLKKSIGAGSGLTWAYDAAVGNIQNLSGDPLLSVGPKPIGNR